MPARVNTTLIRCLLLSLLIAFSFSSIAHSQADVNPPSPPLSLDAQAVPNSKVVLSWKASTDDVGVVGYNVLRKLSSSNSFEKLNKVLVKELSYQDKTAAAGKNYEYVVRAVDAAGNVGPSSKVASAPFIQVKDKQVIMHSGKAVAQAFPGDSIEYVRDYSNIGYGFANNVSLTFKIPNNTTLVAKSVVVKKGPSANILYFDKKINNWVSKIGDPADVTSLKFVLKEPVPSAGKGSSGMLAFKVILGY